MPSLPFTGRITDGFGPRVAPIAGASTFHRGVDGAPEGNFAPEPGQLVAFDYAGGLGWLAQFLGSSGWLHWFGHNENGGQLVPLKTHVAERTRVSVMGSTGVSTGTHCHWETRRPGSSVAVDPMIWYAEATAAATAGGGTTPIEEEDMPLSEADKEIIRRESRSRIFFDAGPQGDQPWTSAPGRAAVGTVGAVRELPRDPAKRVQEIALAQGAVPFQNLEFARTEVPQPMTTSRFYKHLDTLGVVAPIGSRFVENVIALEGGDTKHVRSDITFGYPHRRAVWEDGRPVRCTKGGKTISAFVRKGAKSYGRIDGTLVELTAAEVARADAQYPDGQKWVTG